MNATTKRTTPRKVTQKKDKLLSRREMLGDLKPSVREIVSECDPKTKGFLLDLMRLGQAGVIR